MGFMDKAKEAAQQAKQKGQQMAAQGQAKVQTIQQSRSEAELFRTLGEAYYNEQRHGGDHEAVGAALAALDEHHASAPSPAPGPSAEGAAPAPTTPPASGETPPAAGNFTIDNL
jgi:hypothetical protein